MTVTNEELSAESHALLEALTEGQAAIQELALLKPTLALAISKLEKKQIKVGPHSELGQWALQAKQEQDGMAIVFRAVKA